jgi:hypothetical protein
MIFTAEDPRAHTAQIWDENGENLCKKYFIKWYNTETKNAGIMETVKTDQGTTTLKPDGLGGFSYKIVHLPGSKLVLSEPLQKTEL